MQADRVEVSWNEQKHKWLVRIVIGEEVIRRYCNDPRDTSAETLRASAIQTASDEGYELDPANVTLI